MSPKPIDIAASIIDVVEGVTKDWTKQRKAEERDRSARARRYDRMVRQDRFTVREAAWAVMKDAYMKASDNGRLPARPRQLMYAARPGILELTEKSTLDDRYFTQQLLPDYIEMKSGGMPRLGHRLGRARPFHRATHWTRNRARHARGA
jgi:hypothetical protein